MLDLQLDFLNLSISFIKENWIEIIFILLLIFLFRFIKENIKARIRGNKAKEVISRYMNIKEDNGEDESG